VLGGVKFDITRELADEIRKGLDFLEMRNRHYLSIVNQDETLIARTRGIGQMDKKTVERLGAVGPTARASGSERDLRIDAPYCLYDEFPVKLVNHTAGDLHARFIVRIEEVLESMHNIRIVLDNMPESELTVRVPRRIPAGEVFSRVEAPRGELFYFLVSSGGEKPERVKVRTPSLCNWGTITAVAAGHKLADMPMILSGIDPCFSCNDRLVTVRRNHHEPQVWTWEQLRRYGIEYYR